MRVTAQPSGRDSRDNCAPALGCTSQYLPLKRMPDSKPHPFLDTIRALCMHELLCLSLPGLQADADATATVAVSTTNQQKGVKHPSGDDTSECPPSTHASSSTVETYPGNASLLPSKSWQANIGLVVGGLFFTVVGVVLGRWSATRAGYYNLSEAV